MISRILIVSAAALTLAACGTTDPEIRYVEVPVPVAVDCIPRTLPGAPDYAVTRESLLAAAGPDERYRLSVVGLLERDARLVEVEPVIAACRPEAQ